jgi:hypothetical protein
LKRYPSPLSSGSQFDAANSHTRRRVFSSNRSYPSQNICTFWLL